MGMEDKIQGFIGRELSVPENVLSVDYDLIANRMIDSLGLLQIVSFMETEFGIEVLDEELTPDHFSTVANMVGLITSKLGSEDGKERQA
jgi:acyl carrier protein